MLAQTARVPPIPPRHKPIVVPIVLQGLLDRNLRLPRQARHVRDAQFWRRNALTIATRATTHEAFSRVRMHGLETDVAFLAFVSSAARLDGLLSGKPTTTHSIFFLYGDSKKLSRCCAKRFLLRGAFSEKEID